SRDQFHDAARFFRSAAPDLRARKNPGGGKIAGALAENFRRADQAPLSQSRNSAARDRAESQRERNGESKNAAARGHGAAALLRAHLSGGPDGGTDYRLPRQDRTQSGW